YGEYGVQGNYEVFIEYQQIPRTQFNDGRTPYIGAGGTDLTLPAGWDPGVCSQPAVPPCAPGFPTGGANPSPTPQEMSLLLPSLRSIEVETERQNIGAGVLKHLSRRWKMGVDFHHDTKEGIDTIGGAFAASGGNPKSIILPEPIDYETNRISFFTEYVDKLSMFRFDYEFSSFSNNEATLRFRNPYNARSGWAAGAAFPTGVGEFALEPDNLAHSFSLSAARTLGMTSRIAASLTHTRYQQDENFLPYTANPLLTVTTPLPRNSLDGEIATTIFDLSYTSRPMKKLDVAARYRFEYRDNDTPMDTFIYIAGDAENQPAGSPNDNARINLPYGSGNTHKVKLDSGYRFLPSTKLSLGYEFEQKQRKYSEVNKLREHTVSSKLSSSPFESASGWIRYAHSFRNGSSYRDNLLYLLSHADPSGTFENDPRLRKYFIADRDRDEVRAVLNYIPDASYSVTLDGAFSLDDYDETEIGITEVRMSNITLDLVIFPLENVSANFYATYENAVFEQDGCQWVGFGPQPCINAPPAPADSWSTETDDRVFTVGVGADWQVNSKLGVGADVSFSRALTQVTTTGGSNIVTQPLPDVVSTWYSLGAHANYKVKKNLEARLSYAYEHLDTDDFSVDGLSVNTLNDVITLGEASPNYRGHIIGVAFSYKF
ncbi:MAG: MtrB/PioB family decaheme-associated outer membrane protein, partial [Acidiferrobacterales bacterium]|nr:MtrB/PioB family decaheme-associated outer membrane protein [Acidiferrobacterales bacterium]